MPTTTTSRGRSPRSMRFSDDDVSNVLVAAPIDTATPLSGTGLLESGSQLAAAIDSGDWVEGSLAGAGVAVDTVATVVDPLGSLIGAGLGWLIDHLEPLKGWMNDFTGDAGEVAAFAQTWANIQEQLQTAGDDLIHVVSDVDDLAGEAAEAYRRFQADTARHLTAAASWAGAMSSGLQTASAIVQAVHDLVRDVLSQLIGSIIAWAAQAVFTLGLATPVIVGQVAAKVAAWSARVGRTVIEVLSSCRALTGLLGELTTLLRRATALFDGALRGGAGAVRTLEVTPVRMATPDEIAADESKLIDYTHLHHEPMNDALRGDAEMTPWIQTWVDGATRALERLPDYQGIVLRGEYAEPGAAYLDAYRPGEVVTHHAFTSADRLAPFEGNVYFEIESIHGKRVQHISVHGDVEDEVLFLPGTPFLVFAREDFDGMTFISLREVE